MIVSAEVIFRGFCYISSKKLFLSYVTGVIIADFYVSLPLITRPTSTNSFFRSLQEALY